MNDEQVEQLLVELGKTRQSFEKAIGQIKWNRINTFIQYGMLALLLVMVVCGIVYYLDDKQEACERGNEFRVAIQNSLDSNAASIGIALTIVTGASEERFLEYMEAYNQQEKPDILELRDC